jgi:hypothetical protein
MTVVSMSAAAQNRANKFNIMVTDETKTFQKAQTVFSDRYAAANSMPTATTANLGDKQTVLDGLHDDMMSELNTITQATGLVQAQLQSAQNELQTTNELLTDLKTKDYANLNLTTKLLLADNAKSYKESFNAVCIKVAICIALFFYLQELWFDIFIIFIGIIIVWALITAIMTTWNYMTKKDSGVPLKGSTDSCKNDLYAMPPTVCRDGTADTGSCATTNLCWGTTYGCCADGQTPMSSAKDTCALTPCGGTPYGCCPNGVPKIDQLGSNCTLAASCGFSPWGCTSDGSLRTS